MPDPALFVRLEEPRAGSLEVEHAVYPGITVLLVEVEAQENERDP